MPKLRIKSLLAARGMTIRSLAKKMNVTPQYLGGVVNERSSPTITTLEKIAAALEVPVSSLFADYLDQSQSVAICPYCGGRMNIKTGKAI